MEKNATLNFSIFHSIRARLTSFLMSPLIEKKIKIRYGKNCHINFSYFLARPNRLNELFIRLTFMSQSFEKKIKIRDGKKRHINFSYFLTRPNRLNVLFI
ncbi:hypothetical protein CYV26_10415 [Carnobacterium maltaromaticum]|nr:hypothetical protein CYV33_10400 [Carnobacterium maltaromaticum]PLS36646.1 hypothetical protein CYV30_08035 [Carnobacterium maltaromaticum]PLS37461.1 hypothetical protein CYV31_08040 [Carnobacterium maltaromaticum]PLS43677.1 hypothetical protein CYV28_08050 [Carnobacterium maltaromaticum]PLS44021.1 hypothetical protein CYV27_10400 [Carnobacterium maltaromaticum]